MSVFYPEIISKESLKMYYLLNGLENDIQSHYDWLSSFIHFNIIDNKATKRSILSYNLENQITENYSKLQFAYIFKRRHDSLITINRIISELPIELIAQLDFNYSKLKSCYTILKPIVEKHFLEWWNSGKYKIKQKIHDKYLSELSGYYKGMKPLHDHMIEKETSNTTTP